MNRMDVLSYGDFGIKNGMKILYNKKEITKDLFEKYRKRYSLMFCSKYVFMGSFWRLFK